MTPPRVFRRLVQLVSPAGRRGEIEADLAQLVARVERTRGPAAARRRYRREVLTIAGWRLLGALLPRRWLTGGRRSRRGLNLPGGVGQDLRFAARSMRRSPGFSLVAVGVLSLGIAANTTVFTFVNAAFFDPPAGVTDPDQLVAFQRLQEDGGPVSMGYPDFLYYRETGNVFSGVTAYSTDALVASLTSGTARTQAEVGVVDHRFFDVLGVPMAMGGNLRADGTPVPGGHRVTTLSHGAWLRLFGGDSSVVGSTVQLNGSPYTVAGVVDERFAGLSPVDRPPDFYVPIVMIGDFVPDGPQRIERRPGELSYWLRVVARLRPGVTLEAATAHVDVLEARWHQEFREWIASAGPAEYDWVLTRQYRYEPRIAARLDSWFSLFGAAVVAVLLVAVANVALLLLARATVREREMAVRSAIGAARGRLVRQLLTESAVLSFAGAAGGTLLAVWATGTLAGLLPYAFTVNLVPDARVLAFVAGLAGLTALAFGTAPAWQLANAQIHGAMAGQRGVTRTSKLQAVLVTAQVALSLVLVLSAGLFIRSLLNATHVDLGFVPERRLLLSVELANHGYDARTAPPFMREALDRLRSTPGVDAAAITRRVPFRGMWGTSITVPATEWDAELLDTGANAVTAGYFDAMGIPIRAGRAFTEADGPNGERVVIVNEALAAMLWPGQSALGKVIRSGATPYTVVGVADQAVYYSIGEEGERQLYFSASQRLGSGNTFVLRTTRDPATVAAPAEAALRELDPSLAIFGVQTMREVVERQVAPYRLTATLVTVFGLMALLLAATGQFGLQSYLVAQRAREIGIRMALGARSRQVAAAVVRRSVGLSAVGIVAGLLGITAFGQFMAGMLFGVEARDPLSFVAAPLLLLAVAVAASLVPAARAARVDPTRSLRVE